MRSSERDASEEARRVGLCVRCRFGRRVVSARGSAFWLCELAARAPDRFVKYPRLPVIRCAGFEVSPG